MSLSIAAGETVAIVGATGAGKSTIIKLLPRLYDLQGGAIRIGGADVRSLDPAGAPAADRGRQPGRLHVLGDAARRTSRSATTALTDERILTAARRVGAERVIATRPEGLDARVLERGVNFSAGERQLVAFARALARDPRS